jgi:putative ABC transport system permease protein
VKKTIGATRINILSQFLSESVLVTVLAFILGVVLAWMFLPFTRSVLNTNLDFNLLFCWPYFPILLGSVLLIGLISGSGPAVICRPLLRSKVSGSAVSWGKELPAKFFDRLSVHDLDRAGLCVMIVDRQIICEAQESRFNENSLLRLDFRHFGERNAEAMVLLDELKRSPYIRNASLTKVFPEK